MICIHHSIFPTANFNGIANRRFSERKGTFLCRELSRESRSVMLCFQLVTSLQGHEFRILTFYRSHVWTENNDISHYYPTTEEINYAPSPAMSPLHHFPFGADKFEETL